MTKIIVKLPQGGIIDQLRVAEYCDKLRESGWKDSNEDESVFSCCLTHAMSEEEAQQTLQELLLPQYREYVFIDS